MSSTPLDEFTDLKLFITGPTWLRPEVRQAGCLPEFGHRDSENVKRLGPAMAHLKTLAGAGPEHEVILFNGSGSTAMEAAVRSLVADGETVLHVVVGAFGDLWRNISLANGKKAELLSFAPGEAMDLDRLDAEVARLRPAVVAVTHNETSTGVINDHLAACRLIRGRGALPLVDGVSVFGGAPVDLAGSGCAFYASATQKSLGLPAGFGIAVVSAEALEKAGKVAVRGYSSDILRQIERARKNQTLTTPSATLANQMAVQLDYIVNQEGVAARFARHERLRDQARAFVAGLSGFDFFAPEGHRSPTVTAVLAPEGWTMAKLKEVKEAMRARGYLFDPGYGKLNQDLEAAGRRVCFRIGHMGDMQEQMLGTYLAELGEVLSRI
ncbi:aminotransferase class V [Desulfovibrio sp. X2]|uniref:pyridoxal-phosphate-dependent aminotransferase family protein n=1 Tax=Desulfovibrio sp. X2 TaxID=941449 RepID=UPI00035875D1|nr:aminotransferase class V-fold PLP-dependent enzyme [Desulfovibrio sp. X2]EPR38699.1 aminotransferase class V [Desulfovibrio sp. X2]